MARQGQRNAHIGAGVQQAEQHPLALPNPDGLAMSEHALAQCRRVVHDLQAIVVWWTFVDVLHADPGAFPVMRGEHDFAIVAAGITRDRLDDQEAELASIGAAAQIRHCHGMAVVPARAGRFRGE